ncbi:MAG: hypothetical protein KC613_28075 [Myxococcales bacterium]|nr:hypothetical protein [Myxococcales bacterium]MCB9526325.1 hypothetical protein [Myxococcales bacterium]
MELPFDEQALRAFGAYIVRLQHGGHLTRAEAREVYNTIFRNGQPDLQQGALIGAHAARPITPDELAGITEAHHDEWSAHFPHEVHAPEPHLGIVGVGMDSLKSFNISSCAAVVAAACGAYVHKVGAPGMTGVSGSADAFLMWGVDPFGPLEQQVKAVETTRLGFTSPISPRLRAMGIGRVLMQLRCKTALHFAGPMDNHTGERHKIIGVPFPPAIDMVVQAMKEFGYARALVPCGGSAAEPGKFMDEFSTIGATEVGELKADGTIERYAVQPEDLGVTPATFADIATADTKEGNARLGAMTMAGKGTAAHTDLVAVNAGACLYVLDKVSSYAEGTERAREAMRSGAAIAQLRATIDAQNEDPAKGHATLDHWLS